MSISNRIDKPKLAVVVAAAGQGRRFGTDKLAEPLGDLTVLERALAALETALPEVPLLVVVAPGRLKQWRTVLTDSFPEAELIAGGPRRQDSVCLGVDKAVQAGAEIVVVHDGARPLVHPDDVVRVIDALGDGAAAILVAGVSDTVKRIDGNDVIVKTLDRDRLRLAQTPQVFRVAALRSAWKTQDPSRDFSDEAAILEAGGCEVRSVMAEHHNPKLTTLGDLELMRLLVGDKS